MTIRISHGRASCAFMVIALMVSIMMARVLVQGPSYTDAFYHINAANNLRSGKGLTDDYVWSYLDAPEALPAPAYRYWMPMTSLLAALGIALFPLLDSYIAAQSVFVVSAAATGLVAFRLALMLNGNNRHAWVAGLLTVAGGFYAPRWGAIDTFAPYALFASSALLLTGVIWRVGRMRWMIGALIGIFAALGHLTRPDGLFLIVTAVAVVLIRLDKIQGTRKRFGRQRLLLVAVMLLFYGLTMSPWFARNLYETGSILPVGGLSTIWLAEYNDLFRFQFSPNPDHLFGNGLQLFLDTRLRAALHGAATLLAVEGLIVLAPFMLIALWLRRRNELLRGFMIFAIGIHVAMCLVFPVPANRGGLFHAVVALLPFWTVLGALGVDDVADWIGERRRSWRRNYSKPLFSLTALVFAIAISVVIGFRARSPAQNDMPPLYAAIQNALPDDARVMINDPAKQYYYLGMGGVTLPNEPVAMVLDIARQYQVGFLLLEGITSENIALAAPSALRFDLENPPSFLRPLPLDLSSAVRLYQITYAEPSPA